jgi:hypothetical protein
MIRGIMISGEGVTDLGISKRDLTISEGDDIEVGPVLLLIYKLIYLYAPDWYRDMYDWKAEIPIPTYLVSRGERSRVSKTLKPNLFQTHSQGRGGIEHAKGAWALGQIALQYEVDLCFYFHDTDGTQNMLRRTPDLQDIIVKGALRGFGIKNTVGIAMVPKPTSEAWFICHAGSPPYQHCHLLETSLAGNQDSAERSPKDELAFLLGKKKIVRDDLIKLAHEIDVERLDMPSFNRFKNDVEVALNQIFGGKMA